MSNFQFQSSHFPKIWNMFVIFSEFLTIYNEEILEHNNIESRVFEGFSHVKLCIEIGENIVTKIDLFYCPFDLHGWRNKK